MDKRWWVGGVAAVVVLGAGGAWFGGVFGSGAAQATAAKSAPGDGASANAKGAKDAKGAKGAKPEVTLEFSAREVTQPLMARLPSLVEFSGPLVAPETAVVRAKTGGTLLSLDVAEGQRVRAGQPLGRLDLSELGTRIAERQAMVESARARLAQAERTHASNQGLAAQQFISPVALDHSRAALDTARAELAAVQAALDTTRVTLRDAQLVAPITGIVAKRQAVPGERLQPEQPLLTLVDLRRLELAGAVGTHEVSRLAAGMPVQVRVEGSDQPVQGRIARIAPAAEPGTRSIGVTIELANGDERLRAGQYALARVTLEDRDERLTLPSSAIGSTSGQDHVWVIEDGKLARRGVQVGRRDEREGRVEVLSGVPATATVLAARFDNLREGARAAVVADKAASMASAAASTPALR